MSSAILGRLTPSSIRTQLTLWYLLALGTALGVFAVFVYSVRAQALHDEADAALQMHAVRLARDIRPALLELDVGEALAARPNLANEPVAVRERSGVVLFRSPAFPALGAAGDAAAAKSAHPGDALLDVVDRSRRTLRLATVVAERPGAEPLAVQVTGTTGAADAALREFAWELAFWYLVVLGVASFGGSFITRRALRPVEVINDRVRAIQASSLGERLDVRTGSQELDGLATTLNGMLDRIETSMHGARRFAADASHELQTPLAALRTAVEVCGCGGRTDAECHAVAADLAAELERMSTLIRDLRLLALADAGHLLDRVETVDVASLVRDCCEIVRAIAEPKRIVVSLDLLGEPIVRGSALHLRRALLNLMQNAVQYSPAESTVDITVGQVDADAAVAIADAGCGIADADLPHIFERFYRADRARARDTGGTGLGLAIADQIVRSHAGRIEVTSSPASGSTFLLFLPALQRSAAVSIVAAAEATMNAR
jgi:two-component system, OmpR family, sensor kinase